MKSNRYDNEWVGLYEVNMFCVLTHLAMTATLPFEKLQQLEKWDSVQQSYSQTVQNFKKCAI